MHGRILITGLWVLVALATGARGAEVNVSCGNAPADTEKLNHAIGASGAGDVIRIHGTCLVNQTVVLLGNRSYVGDSRTGTVIRQADHADLPAVVASDSWSNNTAETGRPVRIAHLTIDGNKAANANTSNLVIRSWLTVVEDVEVRNAPADGIRLTNPARDGKTLLKTTQVNGRISNCFVDNSGANGIHVLDPGNSVTDWDLLDSWVAGSGESAVQMDNAAGWKVAGIHVYGVQRHGIYAHRCYGTTIADNYVEGFGSAGGDGKTWYGIACTVQGGAASVIRDNKVFRLHANTPTGNFVYIGVEKVNQGTGVLNVIGNVIRGSGSERDTGLSYEVGGGASLQVLSTENNVQAVAKPRSAGDKVTLVNSF